MSLCGDLADGHKTRACKACGRISKSMERGKTLEEARAQAVYPTCHSCKVRWAVNPAVRDHYNPIDLKPSQVKWLENAARVFDQESDEKWTAEDFIAWLKPDVIGMAPKRDIDPRLLRPKKDRDAA